jgi:chemotaxis protein CheZ
LPPTFIRKESDDQNTMSLISDSFVQMSFQDITGQRIKRIMTLVHQMEEKLKDMIIAFGIKLSEHEKSPDVTKKELQKAVE